MDITIKMRNEMELATGRPRIPCFRRGTALSHSVVLGAEYRIIYGGYSQSIPTTPQTPKGSSRPVACLRSVSCNRLTCLTRSPTVTGAKIVHNRIAQVTIKKSCDPSAPELAPNTPLLSAMELTKKPISPRATIALPSIAAGYSDRGLERPTRLGIADCGVAGCDTLCDVVILF